MELAALHGQSLKVSLATIAPANGAAANEAIRSWICGLRSNMAQGFDKLNPKGLDADA
jgi:hypothetical protein